jgi:L-serine dehydratase
VELAGGDPESAAHAGAIALKTLLGLVCDPVAGLVEVPCVKRNVTGAVNALVAADMALAGIKSNIPLDEVIVTMGQIGNSMPCSLKETAQGGLAITPTALKVKERVLGVAKQDK